ncbi:MAG: hypothetical protein HY687_01145 [Chloroflexi bacterium]|nr:hypothetical protein [Chloroflexota bacterium]
MFRVEISCPFHGQVEKLELPDSYRDFEGEVKCGARLEPQQVLRIKVSDGKVFSVQRA